MEARPTQKQVITSSLFWESYDNVYVQGLDLFWFYQAELYANKIKSILYELDQTYPYYPECRHLATKSRMYRNIILDSHLIIYRITEERIEVLDIVHSASSMRKIKQARNIHIEWCRETEKGEPPVSDPPLFADI